MTKQKNNSTIYFPGLHALRFLAAICVLFGHIELLKKYMDLPHLYDISFIKESGRIAVTLFFVLSGFLISYLLFEEKKTQQTIRVKKFYLRRILRIWPLYFLLVGLAFFVLPHIPWFQFNNAWEGDFTKNLLLFLCFLPQLALSKYAPVPYGEPAWSIGVEEQFYLFWPLIIKYSKRILPWIIGISMVLIACRNFFWYAYNHSGVGFDKQINGILYGFFYLNRLECMLIGAAFAWVLHKKKRRILDFLFQPILRVVAYTTFVILMICLDAPIHNHLIHAFIFGVLIINLSNNPKTFFQLEHPLLQQLGKISYGIYMLHEIAIVGCIQILIAIGCSPESYVFHICLYVFAPLFSILAASLSYKWLEKPFLKLKSNYQVVQTSDSLH